MFASDLNESPGGFPDSPNVFEIDLAAIEHNVRVIRLLIGTEVWFCAALKADAYGFGLIPVAETALGAGVDAIAVGSLDDAARLRRHGVQAPILVYGSDVLSAASVAVMERLNLIATVFEHPVPRDVPTRCSTSS